MKDEAGSVCFLTAETQFAPAGRSDIQDVQKLHALIETSPNVKAMMDGMPFVVLILNTNRQVVAANHKACSLLGVESEETLGKRLGELIGCIHAVDGPEGCGTDSHCRMCGAVNAVLDTMASGKRVTEECRIALQGGGALDWEVTASPLTIDGHSLICVAVRDISHQKRRNLLEHTFFHDIINQLGAISGFITVMADEYAESDEMKEVRTLANELLEEVLSQRNLALAEEGDLSPKFEPVELKPMLRRISQLYQRDSVAKDKTICISAADNLVVNTDPQLLRRVLSNMVKNALEASSEGQTVTMSCDCRDGVVSIHTHNQTAIPQKTQLQIFKRSFSTKKGIGRGIGTYSMKLLGEKYLGGRVGFESGPDMGTVFTITLPKNCESR